MNRVPGACDEAELREQLRLATDAARSAYRDSARLIRLLTILGRPGSPEELVDEGLTALSEVFQADVTALVRWVGGRMVVAASCGLPEGDPAFTSGWSPSEAARSARDGQAVTGRLPECLPECLADAGPSCAAADEADEADEADVVRRLGMASAAWLPLPDDDGRTDHSLILYRRSPETFTQAEMALLGSVAQRLLISVQARRRAAAAELLARTGHVLLRHRAEGPLLAEATGLLAELLLADRAVAFRITADRARRAGSAGAPPTGRDDGPWHADDLPAGELPGWQEVVRSGAPALLRSGSAENARTLVAVPAGPGPEPTAIVYAGWPDLPPLMSPVIETASIVAVNLTAALTNVALDDALGASEASLRRITDSVSDLIAVVDDACRITFASAAHERAVGLDPRALVGDSYLDHVVAEDRRDVQEAVTRSIAHAASAAIEYRLCCGDGRQAWVESVLRPADVPDRSVVMSTRLVEERKRREDELRHRAAHDPLTGLANRSAAVLRLEAALAAGRAGDVGVLYCDLDHFKPVNDRLGHAAGDDLLRQVADRLRACIRADDLIGRLGGDEFVFVLDGVAGRAEAEEVGRRATAALERPFRLGDEEVEISVSVGVAVGARGHAEASVLLESADAAMYAAKRARHATTAR